MPSASADQRKMGKPYNPGAPPLEQEHLLCPRCDSMNTKFCYYNNYNFSQPRYFCKSCRRYWTHGGTLRDIPFGGGSRKKAKRSRNVDFSPSVSVSTLSHFDRPHPLAANSLPALAANHSSSLHFPGGVTVKQNDLRGSFTSLLNTQGPGVLALGGFGLGLGTQFDDGFGLARGGWSFSGVGDGCAAIGGHAIASVMDTRPLDNGEASFVGADCFHWPDLAISSAGSGLK